MARGGNRRIPAGRPMSQLPGTYDLARRALEYLLARMAELREKGLPVDKERLLDETGMHFNLSPLDAAFLARLLDDHIEHTSSR